MTTLAEFKEDFALLTEAGFVAVSHLDEDGAAKMFHAAQLLDDQSVLPKIGLAAIALHKLEVKRAVGILEEVLKTEPDNVRAGALLGIGYLLSNTKVDEGEKLLKEAMEKGDDPATRRLGELWLEVLDKSLRKEPSPASPQKPKHLKEVEEEDVGDVKK
jgi:lipopolysaccharide biosynthesis regulator YciM